MPKSKLFKHFAKKRKVDEFPSRPPPPLPGETNQLAQKQ